MQKKSKNKSSPQFLCCERKNRGLYHSKTACMRGSAGRWVRELKMTMVKCLIYRNTVTPKEIEKSNPTKVRNYIELLLLSFWGLL